jgi:tetratricopeptide (TPR) repeat protein
MVRATFVFSLILALQLVVVVRAQTPPSQSPTTNDYAQEGSVLEEMTTKISFANDGNSIREQTTRARVKTDAGVKQWGLLVFPFQSATQTVDIDYVRVRKADGSTIVTPPDNIEELDSEITRSAPFYSDLREKHVAVKGLSAGDVLEYGAHWRSTKPLITNQFWFSYNFQDGIVLAERLEIKVPSERAVKVKCNKGTQSVTTEGGSRTYSFIYSKVDNNKEAGRDQKKQSDALRGRRPPPDVELSSFQSWDGIAHWYWELQEERVEPSAAIRAKATEITKGVTDDAAKVRALYAFVSTQYRYIGIAFGIGRYQPHAADDVLTNSYGDCKDKHTLLASLLQASGITLYPALINSSHNLDQDVPSPLQFDHIIGYLPGNGGKDGIWLDTTLEIAPPGYLPPVLRDKPALVIADENSIKIVNTPPDPPFHNSEEFKIDGKLTDDGTFEAKIEDRSRGDGEFALRSTFRKVPQSEWKELMQQISYRLGFAGLVSNTSASQPEAVDEPFKVSYSYNRKDYPDWKSDQRFTVPGMPFFLPPAREDAKFPIWLGSPMEGVSETRMEIPKGHKPDLPPDVDLKYDFAEYHASYSLDNGILTVKRRMVSKLREVPVAELDDYRNFVKNLDNDVNRYVYTSSASEPSAPVGGDAVSRAVSSFVDTIRGLPDSNSDEANRLEAEAREKIGKMEIQGGVSSLYRAVQEDPKFTRAWVFLGTLLFSQQQVDAAVEAFHKAIATKPSEPAIQKALGYGLMSALKFEEAISVWQDFMKAYPEDVDGPANLGNCLMKAKRYSEAASVLEAAVKMRQDHPNLQMGLASAYLQAGDRTKAGAAFRKVADVDKDGKYFNDAAYQLANADLELPLALDYAKKAVTRVERAGQDEVLESLTLGDLERVMTLAAYWDTLGWVHERLSNLDAAERYLQASWKLSQDGVVAGHLCHLYRRTHQKAAAIQMCEMAISRMSMSNRAASSEYVTEMAAAQENLSYLTGKAAKSQPVVDGSSSAIRERTYKLPRLVAGTETAEFFVLLGTDRATNSFKVEEAKFISGSEKMKGLREKLKGISFNFRAPSDTPTRFVWRGVLGCYQYSRMFVSRAGPRDGSLAELDLSKQLNATILGLRNQ